MPILSIGTIVFKEVPSSIIKEISSDKQIEFLMIRRNHSFGFMDFMRGKYSIYNKDFLLNLFNEMTDYEKNMILTRDFKELWDYLWNNRDSSLQYRQEQSISEEKFNSLNAGIFFQNIFYSIKSIIEESTTHWTEPEWGFPKGRRNNYERDYDCALREFREETGYSINSLKNIENIMPFEEIFTGSNYKSYKNKYFLLKMLSVTPKLVDHFDKSEVSKMEWKTYEECIDCIRPYNLEKKQLLTNIYEALNTYKITG